MSNGTQELIAALDASPGDVTTIAALERAWAEEGNVEALIHQLPALARQIEDAEQRARFLVCAGNVAREAKSDQAASLISEAYGLLDDGLVLGNAVVAASEPEQSWNTAQATLMEMIALAGEDGPKRARLLYTAGKIWEDRRFDRERSVPYYQQAFKADATFVVALETARNIYRLREHWGTVIKLYSVELKGTRDPARAAELLKEIGDLNVEKLKDAEKGLEAYNAAVATGVSVPGITEAIAEANRLLAEDAEGVEISADLLESSGTQPSGTAQRPAASRPAAAARPAAAKRGAAKEATADVPAAPVGEALPDQLPGIAASIDAASTEYVDVMLEAARASHGRAATGYFARALDRMFQLEMEKADIVDVAVEAISGAEDPVVAVRDLLPALLDRRFTCEDITTALSDVGADPAGVYAMAFYGAGDRDRANDLRADAGAWGEIDALALEWADKGNWRKAGTVIEQALSAAGVADVESEGYRIQAYLCIALDQTDKAADALRRVLRKNKTERQALELSAALYGSLERAPNQADSLKNLVASLDERDTAYRGLLLRQLAALYRDELKQELMVVTTLQQLVEVEPRNIAVLDELAAMLEGMARYPDLVDVLRRKAEALDSAQEKGALYRQIAHLYEERFSNQNEAIRAWEEVIEIDADDQEALEKLDGLYEKRREWQKLIDVKRRRRELAVDGSGIDRLREAADIAATRMRDQDLANQLWNEVLEQDPSDGAALSALEQIHERAKDWGSLADVLARRMPSITDGKERGQALLKLGQLYSDRTQEPEKALGVWESLLALEPENARARDSVRKAYVELERWDDLEAFYARDGSWSDYVRQVETLGGSVSDEATQVDLLFRAARTYIEKLNTSDRAIRPLERILAIEPENADAARLLAPVYEERNDVRKLPSVLEIVLQHTHDDDERFALLVRMAELQTTQLRDADAGLAHYVDALRIRPAANELYRPMLEAAERASAWQVLDSAWSDARVATVGHESARDAWVQLTRLHGNVLEVRVGDDDAALDAADAILNEFDADEEALAARERIFRRREDWDSLLDVLEAQREGARDVSQSAAILAEICRIHEVEREDAHSAIDRYNDLLALREGDRDVLASLRRLYFDTGSFDEYARISSELVKGATPDEARTLRLELATVYVDALDQPEQAIDAYAAILADRPADREAREGLEALVGNEDVESKVAATLRPVYERANDWRGVVDMLEIQARNEEDTDARVALLSRVGELQAETLRDHDAAFSAWSRVLEAAPASDRAREQTEAAAGRRNNWDDVVALYEQIFDDLPQGTDDERALAVAWGERLADLYDSRLDALDDAIGAQQRVLQINAQHWPSRRALSNDLLPRAERWSDLVDVLLENISLQQDATDRRLTRAKLAETYALRLDDADSSVGVWNDVLGEDPTDSEALQQLDSLYAELGDGGSQADILRQRIALQSPGSASQLELKLRLAHLADEQLDDIEQTLTLLSEVVQVSPRHTQAREYLENLLQNEMAALRASTLLEPLYAEDGDDASLSRVLISRLQWEQEPTVRKDLFARIAGMQSEALSDHVAAYTTLDEALREFPEDASLLQSIYAEAERAEQWAGLAGLLDELADEVSDPNVAVDFRTRVARLRREHLGDTDGAADSWRQVLDADPSSASALQALDELYQNGGQWRELVEIVQRKAELAEGQTAIDLHFRAANLYETRLEEVDEAIDVLRGITLTDPRNAKALDELTRLYLGTERWDDLVEVYEAKIQAADSARVKRDLEMQRGHVLEGGIGDDDRAAEAFRAALELIPGDREALDALDANFSRTENWNALLEVLQQKLDVVDDSEQLELMWRAASLRENELSDIQGALADYTRILQRDAAHEGAVVALESMIERGDAVVESATLLDGIYRAAGLWSEVARLNTVRLEHVFEADARRALLVENANLFENELGDVGSAFASLRQAFEEAPQVTDLARLESLAGALENWEELGEVYEQSRDEASDADVRRAAGIRLAHIREEQLRDIDGAIEAYVRVQEETPDDAVALRSLDRLYQQTGNWDTLVDVLRQRIELAGSDQERNGLRLRQANVFQEFMDDGPEAIRVYREVLSVDSGDADAIAALEGMAASGVEVEEIAGILEPIYQGREAWTELVALNDVRAAYAEMEDERFGFYSAMAELQADKLNDAPSAIGSWARALVERPSDTNARDTMELLAGEYDLWLLAYQGYDAVLASDLGEDERADIARRMAAIASENLEDVTAAEQAWLIALEVQPEDAQSLEALDHLYVSQQRWEELSGVLARRREIVFDGDALAELTVRHARLYRDELGDFESAQTTWVEALELQPDNQEVLQSLEQLYIVSENWEALYENYERQLALATEPAERARFLRVMAELNSETLGRPEDAVDAWNRLLNEIPGDRDALFSLAGLHHAAGEQHELVVTYGRLVEVAEDDTERADLFRRIAVIQSWELENDHEGVEYWNRVLAILPEDEEALASLRVLFDRMGDEPALAKNFERQIELGLLHDEELAAVYERLGNIYSDVTNETNKAIGAWTEVRTRVPGHEDALQRLDDLYSQESAWPELVSVLEEKAVLAEHDEDKIELYRRVATVWTADAPDSEKAAAAWESVVDLDLTDGQGIAELERLYAELNLWDELASLHVDRIDVIDDSWEKIATLRKAAEVYRDRLDQPESAYLILQRALAEEPLDDDLRQEVEVLAGTANQWENLAGVYRDLVGKVTDEQSEEDALPLIIATARVQDEHLANLDMAEAFYDRALAVDPENETALGALESIYKRMEDWESLVRILRKRTEIVFEPEIQGALFRDVGAIHEEKRGDLAMAADAYYEALDINDADGNALDALERIQQNRGAWEELIDVLDRRLMHVYEPAEQTVLRFRMAELWRDNVRNDEKAIEAFSEVVMGQPDHIPALIALEEIYGRMEMWDDYVDVLDRRAQADASVDTHVELFGKQAYVYEVVFEDVDRAVTALNSALAAKPDHIDSIESLQRIFEDQERWYDLVDTYERHAAVVEGPGQAEVLGWIGDVHIDHLESAENAVQAFERAIEADMQNEHALRRAAELCAGELERYADAVAYYDVLADATPTAEQRRTALLAAGGLLIDHVGDPAGALVRYNTVRAANEEDVDALDGLFRAHYASGQFEDAVRAVRARIEYTPQLDIRSQLQASIAEIYANHLGDIAQARDLYEEAIDLDPTNIFAASPLVDIHIQEERWERARPLLELLLRDERYQTDGDHLAQLRFLNGRCCEELAFDDEAVEEYRLALDLQPQHGEALQRMAAALSRVGNQADAVMYQSDYLSSWQHALEPPALADAWATLGRYQGLDNDAISAEQSFQNALSVDENHAGALRGLVDLSDANADPALVINAKGRLLAHTEDAAERFRLLTEVGDAYMSLGDTDRAIDHFRSAVDIQPDSRQALSKLLKAYQEVGNWKRATEVLGVLAQTEKDPARKCKLLYAIGLMFRDQLGDTAEAAKFLNVALDTEPTFLTAFQDLDALLTDAKDWKGLERAYRKMLERIATRGDDEATALRKLLFKNLGEVYRTRMQDPKKAIQAFRLASDIDPTDEKLLEILAELYSQHSEDPEEAIAAHRRMIGIKPLRIESYQALFEAYIAKQDLDRAWNMAAGLTMFNKASAREKMIYDQGIAQGIKQPKKTLTREQWRSIRHPDLDPILTELFELVASHVRPQARDIKDHGINKRKDRIDLNEPMPLTRAMQSAIRMVGNAAPELYSRREENGLRNPNADPTAVIVGNDMLQAKPERELLFEVAKMCALLRPEFYLAAALLSSENLRNVLAGALAAVTGQIVGAANVQEAQAIAHDIQRLPEQVQARLRQTVQRLVESKRNPDVSAWLRAVDHTANRAGLLLCGDIHTAVGMVKNEGNMIGKADVQDKVRELVVFSISEEYFEIRVDLSLTIAGQ